MNTEPDSQAPTPQWRDPLSVGFRAHRHLLLLRLRWHERRAEPATSQRRRPLRQRRHERRHP